MNMMESGSSSNLYCELCDFTQFSSYSEFYLHHIKHIRQPRVTLVKLNENLYQKLLIKSYKVNTGVARRSNPYLVSPLKISLKKSQGSTQFQVIKKELRESGEFTPDIEERLREFYKKSKTEGSAPKVETALNAQSKEGKEVEGKSLLERFGANISISRKGASVPQKIKEEPSEENSASKDGDNSNSSLVKLKKDQILERLSNIGGISFTPKSKVPASTNGSTEKEDLKPGSGISIASKSKSIDINQLKKLKEDETEVANKKILDKHKLLEKLSVYGGISISSKAQPKPQEEAPAAPAEEEEEEEDEDYEDEEEDGSDDKEVPESAKKEQDLNCESKEKNDAKSVVGTLTGISVSKIKCRKPGQNESQDSNDSSDSRHSGSDRSSNAKYAGDEELKDDGTDHSTAKRHVRVKNTTKEVDGKTRETESSSDEHESSYEAEKDEGDTRESGIDILERLTDSLNSTVGLEKPEEGDDTSETAETPREKMDVVNPNLPLSPTPSEQLHPDFIAPSQCSSPATGESQFPVSEQTSNHVPVPADCSMLMTPPGSSQDSDSSNYNAVSCPDQYQTDAESDNAVLQGVDEENSASVAAAFSALQADDQGHVSGDQALDQANYWSDTRSSSGHLEQPPQDPLMTGDAAGGETYQNSMLHSFLNDTQTQQANMSSENSEYMSLERLGQGLEAQHQQQSFDPNAQDPNAPMEQLAQQVQRIPNPTPQINVIPHHHMQAPQPPQLHSGLPLSPQHLQAQQANAYDPLSHMQPPMPPLYQGFNVFNQNYSQQSPQQVPPRPPMLHQRPPQIQPRSFHSMAAPPRQRARQFTAKRNMVRLPSPHELTPPKQRRLEPQIQGRVQQQNSPTAKIPSGITITPPKKTVEANKVANVLASRGITVTPAAGRQQPQNARSQQRNSVPAVPPILNISSAISITPSSQNRGSGGFAVPGPRRNAPIVNHNVERPERCTTVDLTLDDDPPQTPRNRGTIGRFSCNQCGKIFTSSVTLENHKATHRAAGTLAFKCDRCSAQYPTSMGLQQHKLTFHKNKQPAPDLAIPIVDLNHPGARDQLGKCGVYNFLPLSQLQSNSNGYFGIPIIHFDTAKEKAVSNLNMLGAGNIFVLGKMKSLAPTPNR